MTNDKIQMTNNEIVLDLETQNSFADVGGRENFGELKVSVCGIYSYQKDKFLIFKEDELNSLEKILKETDRLIGFNIKGFDMPVLQPYMSLDLKGINCLDLLEEVKRGCGRRIGLDRIAQATLGKGKIAAGLDAIKFFREGRFDLLEEYCLDDVRLTKEIYEYGKKYGRIFYDEPKKEVMATWAGRTVEEKIRAAFKETKRVIIEYSSKNPFAPPTKRKVEVYHISEDLIATYCHLKQDRRTFRISKIIEAELTEETYSIPPDFNPQAWLKDLENR